MKSRYEIYREWFNKKETELLALPYEAVNRLIQSDNFMKEFDQYYRSYKEDKPVISYRLSPHKIRKR